MNAVCPIFDAGSDAVNAVCPIFDAGMDAVNAGRPFLQQGILQRVPVGGCLDHEIRQLKPVDEFIFLLLDYTLLQIFGEVGAHHAGYVVGSYLLHVVLDHECDELLE